MSSTSTTNHYSVLLRYPEHLPRFPDNTFFCHVDAATQESAIETARQEATEHAVDEYGLESFDPNDCDVIAIFAGHIQRVD